jgi:hypothetical protein
MSVSTGAIQPVKVICMSASIVEAEPKRSVATLEPGSHLEADEFLRRYKAMPELKKAELVNGIVHMPSPVRANLHAEPDHAIQGWLFCYSAATPGTKGASNATVRVGRRDIPQPDALLRIVPECGGAARLDPEGYLQGPPEFIAEIAASSASMDAHEKFESYRAFGVREYLLWRTEDRAVDWWVLEDNVYRRLSAGADRILRSRVFPGLWLDVAALIAENGAQVLAKLQEGLKGPEHARFVAEMTKRLASAGGS